MSESYCIRGCERQHWAVCPNLEPDEIARRALAEDTGAAYEAPCHGCAPSVCRPGSLICDRCFGTARHLLNGAADLLARLRSFTDDARSGWNWDRVVISGSRVPTAASARDDIADATQAVEQAIRFYAAGLGNLTADPVAMEWLGPLVLDAHPDVDGVRERWSLRDVSRRWGAERGDRRFVHPGALPNAPHGSYARFDDEEAAQPVREWFDPLVTVEQAAERRGVSTMTIRNWAKKGYITPVATSKNIRGNVLTYFHASDVDAVTPAKSGGVTKLDATRARQLFDAGRTRRDMATELGVDVRTVSTWAKGQGLSFERGRARVANPAFTPQNQSKNPIIADMQ